jgi:uncharacterized membrane protein
MFTKLFAIAFPTFLAIDALWLGLVASDFYDRHIGGLLKTDVNWVAALLFYLVFIAGLVVFVIIPAIEKSSKSRALMLGAFFGFVCYATYDLTNLAVAKDWPVIVTVVDLVWGAVIGGVVSWVTVVVGKRIGF